MYLLGRFVLPSSEPLEVYDEELRRPGDNNLLRRLPLAFTVRAFPHLVFAQSFFLAITPQAIVDVCSLALLRDFDADAVESLVSRRRVLAGGATKATGVLTGEEVRDEGAFAVGVALPFDPGDLLDGHPFACEFLLGAERDKRLLFPALIEVLVQAIE